MATVRELTALFNFKVDTSGIKKFDNAILAAKKNVNNLMGNIERGAQQVRNFGFGLSAFVTAPLIAVAVASLRTTSSLEQSLIAMEVFLGSAEKAKKLTKELLDFALETPFSILGVQESAAQLITVGIEADKVIQTLEALGNAARGNSAVFNRLVQNFGQVKTQVKLTGRDLKDFLVNSVPLIPILAKSMGVAEIAIRGLVTAGKIGFKDVEKAFFDASKEGGKFAGLMKKQSKTLVGLFARMTEVIQLFGVALGDAIDEAFNLRENIPRLVRIIQFLTVRFKNLNKTVKTIIILTISLVAALGPFLLVLGLVAQGIVGVAAAFVFLSAAAAIAGKSVLALITIFTIKFLLIAAAVAATVVVLFLFLDDLEAWVTGGDSLLGEYLGSWVDFKDSFVQLWNNLLGFFKSVKDIFNGNIEAMIDKLKIFTQALFGSFIEFDKKVLKGVGLIDEDDVKALDDFSEKGMAKIGKQFDFLKEKAQKAVDFIKNSNLSLLNILFPIQTAFALGSRPPTLAASKTPGNQQNININSNISLQIPQGTPQEQVKLLDNTARKVVREELELAITNTINANPVSEEVTN